jgi:hypothetical protein
MKMTICSACLGFLMVAGVVRSTSAAGPFDGKWNAHVVRPAPAGPQDLIITLTSAEGKAAGSLAIQGGPESPIEWGMIKGDLIAFKVKMPFQNGTQTFMYLGKLEGDRIAFGRRPEDLTLGVLVEFNATRAK